MAIIYVDSAAAGTNAGTSWTNAYTSIASTTGAAAGDFVYVDDGHSQTLATSTLAWTNGTISNPVKILSVDKATDLMSPGATISSQTGLSDLIINGSIFCSGINWRASNDLDLCWTGGGKQIYLDCNFSWYEDRSTHLAIGAATQPAADVLIDGGSIDFSGGSASASFIPGIEGRFIVRNLTITKASSQTILLNDSIAGSPVFSQDIMDVVFEHCDLSGFDNLAEWGSWRGLFKFRNCKVKAGFSAVTGTKNNLSARVLVEGCDDGTITVPPLGLTWLETWWGTAKSSLTRYRTGGADDGEQANAYSLDMTTNANALELYSPLEITLGSRWVESLATPVGATAQNIFTSTRAVPLATPANLTTDAVSTWTGTGVGTKQKINHTLSNGDTLTVYVASGVTLQNDEFWIEVSEPDQVAGLVTVKAFLAKPSTTVYVDPKIVIV